MPAQARAVFIKPETLQRTGSFKFRGAFNKISQLPQGAKGGVWRSHRGTMRRAWRRRRRFRVLPADHRHARRCAWHQDRQHPQLRRRGDALRPLSRGSRAGRGAAAAERAATLVRPYDDPDIIAGQGTIGLEIARQCQAKSAPPDIVLSPCGGGGMIAAARRRSPRCCPA
jgi:threonine dehydratase